MKLSEKINKNLKNIKPVFAEVFKTKCLTREQIASLKAVIATVLVFGTPTVLLAIMFREPLLAFFKFLVLLSPAIIVYLLLAKSADLMDKGTPQQLSVSYPVFRGFQPGSNYCQAALVNEEFKEIADYFESCYFDNFVERKDLNCVVYTFQIRTRKGMELSYELIDLIQHVCEKLASVFFTEYGLYRVYSDVVACTFTRNNKLLIAFATNPQGEAQIVNLRNQVYQQWHKKASGNEGSSKTMTENVPEIPPEETASSKEEIK